MWSLNRWLQHHEQSELVIIRGEPTCPLTHSPLQRTPFHVLLNQTPGSQNPQSIVLYSGLAFTMSLYTPVFPPSLECRSTGHNGAPSSNQRSSGEILRDIHLFLATKPEVLAPSSRPSSPSFDTNVENLKRSVLDAIETTRGDTGSGKWKEVSEKLRMGCVRGRYRMTGRKQGWHPPEDAEWILPDDEETWFRLQEEKADTRRLKGKVKRSCHPDDMPATSAMPSHGPDIADTASPVEIVDLRETVSPKTMRNVTKKVTKWRETISTEGAAPVQRSASKPDLKGKTTTKNKNQSSSLGFPVVKRNTTTVAGKKGEGCSDRTPLPNLPAHGVRDSDHIPNGSKALAAQGRQSPCNGKPEKASIKSPLRSVVPDGDLPTITDFPETVSARGKDFFCLLSNLSILSPG